MRNNFSSLLCRFNNFYANSFYNLVNIKKSLRSGFVKDSIAYGGTSAFIQGIIFVRGFVVRSILPPAIMGFWNLVGVVGGFLAIFDLGCTAGASRELPILHGRGDREEETRCRSTTIWFMSFQGIVVGLFALGYVWWNRMGYSLWQLRAFYTGIIIYIIMGLDLSYQTFFISTQAYVPLSKLLLTVSIIEGVSFPISAYLWGVGGIMTMAMITACLKFGLLFLSGFFKKLHAKFACHRDVLKRLLGFGFFLRLVDYPSALFVMINVLWVTRFMSIESLALFSIARSFFLQVSDVSSRVGTVYATRYLQQYGSGTPKGIIAMQMKQFLLFQLLVAVPLLCWAGGVVLPFLVRSFIPKYSGAIDAIIVLLICSFFYVLNSGLTNYWVAEKKLVARGIANVVGLIAMLSSLIMLWFVLGKRTITGVAYATLAGYFIYFVYMVIAVGKDLWSGREVVEILLLVIVASLWTSFILSRGLSLIKTDTGFVRNLYSTMVMGFWTLLVLLPIPLYGLKKSRLLKGWAK